MKGVTPVIAIIILLLITVSLAGLAWTYLSGVLTGKTEGSFIIIPNGVFCEADGGNNHIKVWIQNTGVTKHLKPEDFVIVEVDGENVSNDLQTFNIPPRDSGLVLDTTCNEADGCASGIRKVRLGTTATVQEQYVTCP